MPSGAGHVVPIRFNGNSIAERRQVHRSELQSLAGMHGHEPDAVDAFDGRRRFAQCTLVAEDLQPSNPSREGAASISGVGTVILDGELKELMDRQAALLVGRGFSGEIVADEAPLEQHRHEELARSRLEADAVQVRAESDQRRSAYGRNFVELLRVRKRREGHLLGFVGMRQEHPDVGGVMRYRGSVAALISPPRRRSDTNDSSERRSRISGRSKRSPK